MANRLSQEKANAIASEYMTNGHNKVQALLAVGYSVNYANHGGLKLLDNDRVKQAIARIQAKSKVSTDYDIATYMTELNEIRTLSIEQHQLSTAATATIAKGRTQGYDKDNDLSATDKADPIPAQRQELLQQQAAAYQRELIKLDKDTG